MAFLEHKIPPPLVALLCAALAWWLASGDGGWRLPAPLRVPLGALCLAAGVALDVWALAEFRRQRTTPSPLAPQRARAVVERGPYRFTRNPMYLGLVLILLALCLWRGHALALVAPAVFVAYITRYQIVPEERALRAKFGAAYEGYLRRVRRWL